MTTRQQIIANIAGRLQQIAVGTVFQLPDGEYVCSNDICQTKPWHKNPFSREQLPAIAWRDGVTRLQQTEYGRPPRYSLRMIMAAYTTGPAPASIGRGLLADMLAAIGSDPRCGGLAHWTEPDYARLLVQPGGAVTAAVELALTIWYTPLVDSIAETYRLLDEHDNLLIDGADDHLTW